MKSEDAQIENKLSRSEETKQLERERESVFKDGDLAWRQET